MPAGQEPPEKQEKPPVWKSDRSPRPARKSARLSFRPRQRFPFITTLFIILVCTMTALTIVAGIIAMPSLTGYIRDKIGMRVEAPVTGMSAFFLNYFHYVWYLLSGVVTAMITWGVIFYVRSPLDFSKRVFVIQISFFTSYIILVTAFFLFVIFAFLPMV